MISSDTVQLGLRTSKVFPTPRRLRIVAEPALELVKGSLALRAYVAGKPPIWIHRQAFATGRPRLRAARTLVELVWRRIRPANGRRRSLGSGSGRVPFENLLHFLHVLAVIVWVGGVLSLNVLAVRVGIGPDRAVQASLLRMSDFYGRAVIAPAGALTLITGLLLVGQLDLALSTLWVAWGMIGLVLSVALGATLIRATNGQLRRLTESPSTDDPSRLSRQRRAAILYGLNLLLLLSVLWAMVFKPTA